MKERGQVSIFIVLAVVIVIILVLFFLFNKNYFNIGEQKVDPEIQPVQLYVQNCIKEVGDDAIYTIGQNGGYYKLPQQHITTPKNESFVYYLHENNNLMPSKEKVEAELSSYMEDNLKSCVGDFNAVEEFSIRDGDIKTKTLIEEEKVTFDVNYPLTISKEEKSYSLENFNENIVYVRLGIIYSGISEYMTYQEENSNKICMTCLYDIANESDLYVDVLDYDPENIFFVFIDENSKINEQVNYTFKFANKYE